jgi:hypothetical protein
MRTAFDRYEGWKVLLRRLVRDGYLDLPPEVLEALLPGDAWRPHPRNPEEPPGGA